MIKLFITDDDLFYTKVVQHELEKFNILDISHFGSIAECSENLHLHPHIVIIDFNLPDGTGLDLMKKVKQFDHSTHAIIISGQEELEVVVKAYKEGAQAYIIKNENAMVELSNAVKNSIAAITLQEELETLREQMFERNKYDTILGSSPKMMTLLKMIQKVEGKDIQVMITGESGTGKELVAQAIHYHSQRKKKPFVIVDMGAIPEDLVESELFGHEKGAFTGANSRRIGKFEEAHKGTIFLDEIGEIDLNIQKKLLRVLQEQEVVRLGSNKPTQLDVRIIAATNKDLEKEVKEGRFREDLFYRIQGFLIHLPPLRDRGNDVIVLAKAFLERYAKENGLESMKISKEVMQSLLAHTWPGNVRELKSLIERAALMADGNIIIEDDIIFSTRTNQAP